MTVSAIRAETASALHFATQAVADARSNRTDAFSAILMPYADQLYDHARRELNTLEDQGDIPRGEFAASDRVDEQRQQLARLLRELPKYQRQTLMLKGAYVSFKRSHNRFLFDLFEGDSGSN